MKPLGKDLVEIGELVTAIDAETTSTFSAEDVNAAIKSELNSVIDGVAKIEERTAVCVTNKTMCATAAFRLRHMAARLIWTARTLDALRGS